MEPLRWRGDINLQLPFRDFIRRELPGPHDGLVAADVDLILRAFGLPYGTDARGKFRMLEIKCADGRLTNGERQTFRLVDDMLRSIDPGRRRYLGYFTIWTEQDDWTDCELFDVERLTDGKYRQFTRPQFLSWLNFDVPLNGDQS
jgi:hypothetical protein